MTTLIELVGFYPSPQTATTSPRSSGDRATASGAVCAGSNPAGGTLDEVPKDPATSGFARCGVFLYAQPDAALSRCLSVAVAYSWRRS